MCICVCVCVHVFDKSQLLPVASLSLPVPCSSLLSESGAESKPGVVSGVNLEQVCWSPGAERQIRKWGLALWPRRPLSTSLRAASFVDSSRHTLDRNRQHLSVELRIKMAVCLFMHVCRTRTFAH
ncbi:unnamed protein product [Protopolystoma xenopodis]|uniref:Uncharacterized protein n=1 Tax=Protopolystoma xenopodis TaxID=117903 RepID=A0A3S5C9D4_9PLAT|nr:unnamed protein product [Protopolystoma xenopodis]